MNRDGRLGPGSGTLRDDWKDWNVQGVTLGNNGWEDNIMGEYVTSENVQLYIKEEKTAVKCERYNFLFQDTGKTATTRTASSARCTSATSSTIASAKKVNDLQALKAMTFYYELGKATINADFVPEEV